MSNLIPITNIKLFHGTGYIGIEEIEKKVNEWLDSPNVKFYKIVSIDFCLGTIGTPEDLHQSAVCIIRYEKRRT